MTRQFRRRLIAVPVAAAVAAATIGLAPATAMDTSSAHTPISITAIEADDAQQDGMDLFRAVFFMQGDMADVLLAKGALDSAAAADMANQSPEAAAVIDQVVEAMHKADPTFFTTLSEQLRSGDPFQVEAGLMDGTDLLNEVGAVAFGGDEHSAAAVAMLVVMVVFVAVAAVATMGAAVVHTAAAVKVAVFSRYVVMGGRALDAERQIASLTRALASPTAFQKG
ncbi:hypothetical protein [Ornithinimicrobium pratense]|uniref:Sporulation delaying protein family toxin n=1 Tax=Ornithinimicrobium pratense TaxID=2593973 RepID=A0A5J6V8P8_9MICO|nr:hypothetical protein [Ornithinimicrobium pratense]QFG69463.1 hypothetical protein FY030_12785 [Ornithinimicrobium pratense]